MPMQVCSKKGQRKIPMGPTARSSWKMNSCFGAKWDGTKIQGDLRRSCPQVKVCKVFFGKAPFTGRSGQKGSDLQKLATNITSTSIHLHPSMKILPAGPNKVVGNFGTSLFLMFRPPSCSLEGSWSSPCIMEDD